MFRNSNNALVDLHGLSSEKAKHVVHYWLLTAARTNIGKIRFVTGKGNHINAKGERGTLYKNFMLWIEESIFKSRISRCEQHDGYFEVSLMPTSEVKLPMSFSDEAIQSFMSTRLQVFEERANAGDPYFEMLYGLILEKGEDVAQDFKQAAQLFSSAATKGYAPAMHELARCYLHGVGVRQSDYEAYKWLEKAAKLDYTESVVALGDCYWLGHGVKQNERYAVGCYSKAAARQHPLGMRKLASAYNQGVGIEKNQEKAFYWYHKSADLGDAISQYNTAVMLINGFGTNPDLLKGHTYLVQGAKNGDPDAQFLLGFNCWYGKGVEANKKEGIFWLEKASENGSAQASRLLCSVGEKKYRDLYLMRAAQAGDVLAKVAIGVKQNEPDEKFNEKLHDAIKDSYDLSENDITLLDTESRCLLLDSMLWTKRNKPHIKYKSWSILRNLAEQQCIYALRRMFMIYAKGLEAIQIKEDFAKALTYLQKSVDIDDSKAMVLMGFFSEDGKGMERSYEKAMVLYQRAAALRNPTACFNLAIMHLKRLIPDPSIEIAYSYSKKALEYEADTKNTSHLESGFVDKYLPCKDRAQATVDFLDSLFSQMQESSMSDQELERDEFQAASTEVKAEAQTSQAIHSQASFSNNHAAMFSNNMAEGAPSNMQNEVSSEQLDGDYLLCRIL